MPLFGLIKPNLEKLKANRDIAGLMKATADPEDLGKKAAEALADIGTSTIPSLIIGLRSADDNVRIRASYALTIIAKNNGAAVKSSASQPLTAALKDRHAFVRYNACCALGRACADQAVGALLDVFGDADTDNRIEATWAVTEIFKTVKDSPYRARAAPLFTQALRDANDTVRQNGAYGLGQVFETLDDPALAGLAFTPLMACANDKFDMVRINMAESLGDITPRIRDENLRSTAIDFLIARLADPDLRLRRSGGNALGKIRDARAVMPLLVSLADADGQTRVKASWALTEIFDVAKDSPHRAGAVAPFIAALKDTDDIVRQNAVYGLEHIFMTLDDPALAETAALPLIASMRDSFIKARINAAGALGVVASRVKDAGKRAMMVDALIAGLGDTDGGVRQLCCTSLGNLGDAKAVDALTVAIHDPEQYVRKKAAIALGQIGDKRAVPQLLVARDDKVDFVRQAAREALDKLGWKPTDVPPVKAAVPPLDTSGAAALIKKLSLKPRELEMFHPEKYEAMGRLEKMGAGALEPLLAALGGADTEARGTIIYLLGKLKDERALLPIARCLANPDTGTKVEALAALRQYPAGPLGDGQVKQYLEGASKDANIQVREEAGKLLKTLGSDAVALPWYHGTATWNDVSKAFKKLEAPKPGPDFGSLAKQLERFSPAERHGAWYDVAFALKDKGDKNAAARCFAEALRNSPDPRSTAWTWLELPPGAPEALAMRLAEAKNSVTRTPLAPDKLAALAADLSKFLGAPGDKGGRAAPKDMAGILKEKGLRPLGNKKRLVPSEKGCLDYRAQFRDRASAERYYEAFVKYAERNPPPVLIEVMAAFTPNTIYSEKYSFILPYFNMGVREDYQKWAREAILSCNDVLRQHSYSAGNSYEYVPQSISSKGAVIKWTILPPRGFDPDSTGGQELLSDLPETGYKTVNIEGAGVVVPVKPDPQGPWIGVLFDISKFEEAWYGRAATKQLMDIVGVQQLAGCVIHGGDMLPDARFWCNAIHAASQEQANLIDAAIKKSGNEKLARDRATVIRGSEVPVNTLPFQGFVSKEGVYVGN